MGEWQKLTAEAATLEKLVQVHRLQHRRTGYFARVLDVRRGVRAVLGKGAHLAQVEQALHAIRAAWKDCLLYTSPSPRDMRRSRMPSSA